MALGKVSIAVQSGGLGNTSPNPGSVGLEAGWATAGAGGVVNAFADTASLVLAYANGPVVEAAAYLLAAGAPQVDVCRIFSGTLGATVHVGAGVGTVTYSGAPISPYGNTTLGGGTGPIVLIAGTGALGVGTFQYSLDGGKTYAAAQLIPASGIYPIPNTGMTATFAGASFTAADTYIAPITAAVGAAGAVVQVGAAGPAQGQGLITTTGSSPIDDLQVVVKVLATGVLGVGTFQYSFDGGLTFSATTLIPSSGGPVVVGNGIQLTFANTGGAGATSGFVLGDLYSFATSRPGFTTTDFVNVCGNIVASALDWDWMHLVGRTSTPAAAATLAGFVDSQMTAFAAAGRYCFGILECPPDASGTSIDQALLTAFASFTSDRTCVAAGDANVTSALQGTQVQRSVALPISARCAIIPPGEDLGRVQTGRVLGVSAISRDETATPNLDTAGFATAYTQRGTPGFFVTGRLFASPTSSFQLIQYRRVMDKACKAALPALQYFLNSSVRVNPNGTILEADARTIENYVAAKVAAVTTQAGQASGLTVQVSRTANILATSTLPVTITITALGYAKQIAATIGYANPALALQ